MYKIPASLRSDFSECRFARIECHFVSESVPISSEYATDLSTRAAPSHPEEPDDCFCPLLHRRFQASSFFGRLATPTSRHEAETGSLALRLACSPCKASPVELLPLTLARLLVERAIYKISSFQNIRSARLILALRRRRGLREREFEIENLCELWSARISLADLIL